MSKYFIWGMGLLGASLGLDLRKLGHQVSGCVRSQKNIDELTKLNFDDIYLADDPKLWESLASSHGIIIGTPVEHIFPILDSIIEKQIPESIWITDMASTKGDLVNWVNKLDKPLNFIGSHPMAGSDLAGPEHSYENLFKDATIYVTPANSMKQKLSPGVFEKTQLDVEAFWKGVAAKPYIVSHTDHDKWAAYLSHGLHLVSCMVSHLLKDIPGVFEVPSKPAGGSFRDITRVAGANPQLWDGIIGSNLPEVISYMKSLEKMVHEWTTAMEQGTISIEAIFEEAAKLRGKIIKNSVES